MKLSGYDDHLADLSQAVIKETASRRFDGGVDVHVLESVGSTNTWVKTHLSNASLSTRAVLLCATEHQTAGRGRRGKTWHSPDRGVTFSLAFTVGSPASELSGLSLLCGEAVCKVLRSHGIAEARVKWPNDILVNGAKLAGILVEVIHSRADSATVIVGIGINYRRGQESEFIDQSSTDLSMLFNGKLPDRSELIGAVAGELLEFCHGDIPHAVTQLARRWHEYDALHETSIGVEAESDADLCGLAAGIDGQGRLLLKTANGVVPVAAGSISIRGVI